MRELPHFCGGKMAGSQTDLCEPLAQLKREHEPLRERMNAFAREAEEIGASPEIRDWALPLTALDERVAAFVGELDPHSEREEGHLFPMMAKYIGREAGPIAVMEYEHEQAKQWLRSFREAVEQAGKTVTAERAKEIASYALRAQALLTDHFMKEENVLFPMAEKMLNEEEKAELSRAFGLGTGP